MDQYTTAEWTVDFVKSNRDLCFSYLKEANDNVISLLKNGNSESCAAACYGLNQMMNGAVVMQNAGIANLNAFISTNSFNVGIIVAFGCTSYPVAKRKETAIAALEDCKDFSNGGLTEVADQLIEMLKSSRNLDDIRDETFPNFPEEVIDLMSDTRKRLEKIQSTSSSSETSSSTSTSSSSSGGCYVATCVYGSYDCPQVWTLRRYRDYILAGTWYGRVFIRVYYAVSPTLVKWFGTTDWFKNMWKPKLDRMVKKLQDDGIESTPYMDRNW